MEEKEHNKPKHPRKPHPLTCTSKYTTLIGSITTKKIGVAIEITTMVLKTLNTVIINERKDLGIVSSIIFTSFENRFRIRPRGVVSKKDMGERRMFSRSFWWSVLEARNPAMATAKEEPKMKKAWEKPNVAYTPR